MTTTSTRAPRPGYIAHDHTTNWQECDTCGLRTGEGITTRYDAAYYAGDPAACPSCASGLMCLPAPTAEREIAWWDWHDADASRASADMQTAEDRCAAWVAGTSDDGPEDAR